MPRGKHAPQHTGRRRHAEQARAGRDPAPASARPRRRTLRYGTAALAAVFCLLVGTTAMRAAGSHGSPAASASHGSPVAASARICSRMPRLAADTSATPVTTTPLGANVSGVSGLDAATAQFGDMPVIRVYYGAVIPSPQQWSTGVLGLNKSSVVVSFRPLPQVILSGADDTALVRFFDAAPRGHAIYYSYFHEPEAHIKEGQFTFAQYKAAWTHIVAIADAAHNPYLHSTLILQHQDADPGDQYNFRNYLPANGVISTLGWDAYPVGTDDGHPQPTPPVQFMGPAVAASKSVGLPFGFAEFALGTPTDRPQWLTEVANYMQRNGALFGTLFHPTVLHDSASIQAWRAAVARSVSGAPVPAPSAAHTPPAPAPTTRSPAAPPSPPVRPSPSPAAHGLAITGLTITPRRLRANGANHVKISFKISRAANVAICVLNAQDDVVREADRPGSPAGWAARKYYGYNQHHRLLPAGCYQAMVIASNATGSATAQLSLLLTRPGPRGGRAPERPGSVRRADRRCLRQPGG